MNHIAKVRVLCSRLPAVLIVALAAAGLAACVEEPTRSATGEDALLPPGLNVYLTLSDEHAAPGSLVRLTGKVRAIDVDLTPTAFLVQLNYDPKTLEPVTALTLDDGVLRAINLEVAPGTVKAAGAAANGLDTDVLFELEMKVNEAGYAESLSIAVDELGVIERNFADVAADVAIMPRALVVGPN